MTGLQALHGLCNNQEQRDAVEKCVALTQKKRNRPKDVFALVGKYDSEKNIFEVSKAQVCGFYDFDVHLFDHDYVCRVFA
jgi:hypothetical protein